MLGTAPDEERVEDAAVETPAETTASEAGEKKKKEKKRKSKASKGSEGEGKKEKKQKKAAVATESEAEAADGKEKKKKKKKKKSTATAASKGEEGTDAEASSGPGAGKPSSLMGPRRPTSGSRGPARVASGVRPSSPGSASVASSGRLQGGGAGRGQSIRAKLQRRSVKSSSALSEAQRRIDEALADNERAGTEFMQQSFSAVTFDTADSDGAQRLEKGSTWGSVGQSFNFGGTARSMGASFYNAASRVLNRGTDIVARLLGEEQPDMVETQSEYEVPLEGKSTRSDTQVLSERGYSLRRVPYRTPNRHSEDSFWTLQSGQGFPSYHCNPTREGYARFTDIPGIKLPIEDIRAPRIRLAPQEWEEREKHIEAIKIKALQQENVLPVHTLNLSYQSLGDPYQMEHLTAFLDVNRGVRRLALTDNQIQDLSHLLLEEVEVLYVSRNMILSWAALPSLPKLQELYITRNFIGNTNGLSDTKFPQLRKLHMRGNPICTHDDYLEQVQDAIPDLTHLDGHHVDVFAQMRDRD